MRILEGLEGRGFRLPLTKGEAELAEKLVSFIRQVGVRLQFLLFISDQKLID